MRNERARESALRVLEKLVSQFPGIVYGDDEVNGGDVVEALSNAIASDEDLNIHLSVHTIDSEMTKE